MGTELRDDKLISESYGKNPYPFWFWLIALGVIFGGLLLIQGGLARYQKSKLTSNPFYQVTNREFSLFLWQNPEFMRVNVKSKYSYLPAFQYLNSVAVEPDLADELVVAPPKILFLYHTWKRLIGDQPLCRELVDENFEAFLDYDEQWKDPAWQGTDEIKRAALGWKNFVKEGQAIDSQQIQAGALRAFLEEYPHFQRNWWRNIIGDQYLQGLEYYSDDAIVPNEILTGFLKVNFYNCATKPSL